MKAAIIRWALVCLAITLFAGMALAAEAETPKAKPAEKAKEKLKGEGDVFRGTGRARETDEKAAREKAIIAAKVDAFEKAVERLAVLESSRLREVIERYATKNLKPDECFAEVVVEHEERNGNITKVTVAATLNDVLPKTVAKILKRSASRGDPTVMVVLREEVIQPADSPPVPEGMTAQIAIENTFIKEGLTVVDHGQVAENDRNALNAAVMEGDMDTVRRITLKHKANVLVGPRVPARADYRGTVPMGGGQWPRYGAMIQARLVDSDIGQILGAQDTQGSSAGETHIPAAHNALKDAGEKIAKELVRDIFWHWFGPDEFSIRVSLIGVPHAKALMIADSLVNEEDWAVRHGTVGLKEGECTFVLTVADPTTSAIVADTIGLMDRDLKLNLVTARRVVLQKAEE